MTPNVEKGQVWRVQTTLNGDGTWRYAYFLIVDIRASKSKTIKWRYVLQPLTPHIDCSTTVGYKFPLNHHLHWEFVE